MRRNRSARLAVAVALATALLTVGTAVPASAATAAVDGSDVSYPQCDPANGTAMAAHADPGAFAIVGLTSGTNNGLADTVNPCFAAELAWARTATGGAPVATTAIYVNAQNPDPSAASWWPTGNRTRANTAVALPAGYGTCSGTHTASRACAYVYGTSIAEGDVAQLATFGLGVTAYRWWIDVETSNDWWSSTTGNRAVVEGMAQFLRSKHASVGLYSSHTQLTALLGTVPTSSALAGLASWRTGATTAAGAGALCTGSGLVPSSSIAIAQWVAGGVDHDIACRSLTTRTPTVQGTAKVGKTLTARVTGWTAGVTLSYQWQRDGKAIRGATHRTYRLVSADAKHSVRVRVAATLQGYRAAAATSAAHRIGR